MGVSRLTDIRRGALVSNGPIASSLRGSIDERPARIIQKGMSSTPAKRVKAVALAVTRIEYSDILSHPGILTLAVHDILLPATLLVSSAASNSGI